LSLLAGEKRKRKFIELPLIYHTARPGGFIEISLKVIFLGHTNWRGSQEDVPVQS
jgi:hypothetical protein